jgi:hypothetical protein
VSPPLRDARGRILPGQAALNPTGRPKGIGARIDAICDSVGDPSLAKYSGADKIFAALLEIAIGKTSASARTADKVRASELLLAYKFGKPAQTVDLTVEEKGPRPPSRAGELPLERLVALRAEYQKALNEDIVDAEIVEPKALPVGDAPASTAP